ncbi:MAG: polyphosphate:AMP phosphotransferase [Acidobacteriota bacterium]
MTSTDEETRLRTQLLIAQTEQHRHGRGLAILLGGDDRREVNAVLNHLHARLDPRHLSAAAFGPRTDVERARPPFWRYWQALPARGRIAVLAGGWTRHAILLRLRGRFDDRDLDRRLAHIRRFERMLQADGVALLKLWLSLPEDLRRSRLREDDDDAYHPWYTGRDERKGYASRPGRRIIAQVLEGTTASASWHDVAAADADARDRAVLEHVLRALRTASHASTLVPPPAVERRAGGAHRIPIPDRLGAVDLHQALDKATYRERLDALQQRLGQLSARCAQRGVPVVAAFEGWDAAGKGGAIRRVTGAMDAVHYRVHRIAAPTDEERDHPYLWRFWRRLPRDGRWAIFDRSWYGRVLVERVEGFAEPADWQRAYAEINDFEAQLVDHGAVVAKFWLHIDPDEQMRRFEARARLPYKRYKLTDEDIRNRDRWRDYADAANAMFAHTDRPDAPWTVVAANDKRLARVTVLEALCAAIEQRLADDAVRAKADAPDPADATKRDKKGRKDGDKKGAKKKGKKKKKG